MDLESTIRDLAPRVLRYCRVRLRDRDLAAEIAQDSLAALVHRWNHHGPPDSPEAFVFAVARRRATRLLWRRRALLPIEAVLERRDGRPDPEHAAVERSEREWTYRALGDLPRHERDALLLVVVGELTTAEAARVLGTSPSAVKMRTSRARERLLAWWEKTDANTRER